MKRVSPTYVEVDLEALRHNYRQLRGRLPGPVKALAVVKSNAYGHGGQRVAKTLQDEGADAFGVGTIDEGLQLREAGIKKPIFVLMGLIEGQEEAVVRYGLTPVVYDLEAARILNDYMARSGKRLPVHLKVDTGMTRLGFQLGHFPTACAELKKLPFIDPAGLLTHLAEAGNGPFTAQQWKGFEKAKGIFDAAFGADGLAKTYHVANSQASIDRKTGEGDYMARFGIALYGAYPLERNKKDVTLKPVLQWKSRVISVKEVPSKTPVSYNRTYVTKKVSRIAVVPVGYADGYSRLLSNRAQMIVRGKRAKVAGIVCMDLTMLDVTHIPGVSAGDEVTVLGRQGAQEIRAEEMAAWAKTISYEVFCRISERVPRVYL
ncbi:MAG TPA: alanine racemase [bacterium]|nr:alanine racemase [bacterium]